VAHNIYLHVVKIGHITEAIIFTYKDPKMSVIIFQKTVNLLNFINRKD